MEGTFSVLSSAAKGFLPALLSLPSVLSTLARRVTGVLNATGDALQTVADSLGASGVVDGVADAATSSADETTGSLSDAAYGIAELGMR